MHACMCAGVSLSTTHWADQTMRCLHVNASHIPICMRLARLTHHVAPPRRRLASVMASQRQSDALHHAWLRMRLSPLHYIYIYIYMIACPVLHAARAGLMHHEAMGRVPCGERSRTHRAIACGGSYGGTNALSFCGTSSRPRCP